MRVYSLFIVKKCHILMETNKVKLRCPPPCVSKVTKHFGLYYLQNMRRSATWRKEYRCVKIVSSPSRRSQSRRRQVWTPPTRRLQAHRERVITLLSKQWVSLATNYIHLTHLLNNIKCMYFLICYNCLKYRKQRYGLQIKKKTKWLEIINKPLSEKQPGHLDLIPVE